MTAFFEGFEADAKAPPKPLLLWQFLQGLLDDPSEEENICWINRAEGANILFIRIITCHPELTMFSLGRFVFKKPAEVARKWGLAKGNSAMTYDNMSRNFRSKIGRRHPQIVKPAKSPNKTFQFVWTTADSPHKQVATNL